jgi:hypothetical protein
VSQEPLNILHVIRISGIDVVHELGEIHIRRSHEKMVVIAHDAVGEKGNAVLLHSLDHLLHEEALLVVITQDILAAITPREDVIDEFLRLNPGSSRHLIKVIHHVNDKGYSRLKEGTVPSFN